MDLKKLGSYKISESINTQWETNLAVDRIKLAAGEKTSGLASFLNTLDYIGTVFSLIFSLLIITVGVIYYVIKGIIWLVKLSVRLYKNESTADLFKRRNSSVLSDEDRASIEECIAKIKAKSKEEEMILAMFEYEEQIIPMSEIYEMRQLLAKGGYGEHLSGKSNHLEFFKHIYNVRKNELIVATFEYTEDSTGELMAARGSHFLVYSISPAEVEEFFFSNLEYLGLDFEFAKNFDVYTQVLELHEAGLFRMEKEGEMLPDFDKLIAHLKKE